PFLMEMPPYKRPSVLAVLQRMWQAGKAFLVRAGTLILATSVLVWALGYFPHKAEIGEARDRRIAAAEAAAATAEATAPTPRAKEAARAAADEEKKAAESEAD